ncbi:MAG TPA: hypothetical protein VGN20_06595 [Mucilaginibacter sp.]|jgi:hypothetical protein
MKKLLPALCAIILLSSGCSKDHAVIPAKNIFKITAKLTAASIANSTWQQVLGGEVLINFKPISNDTVNASAVKDSLNLQNVSTYVRSVFAGTYNVSLNTESTAVADTFIRFTSQADSVDINKDQTINFAAVTNDGVITIDKKLTDTTVIPTFTASGTTKAVNFGGANGYYFIYVSGNTTGTISFVEATSGYTYMKQLTITTMNQYDLSPILNSTSIRVRQNMFRLLINTKHNL